MHPVSVDGGVPSRELTQFGLGHREAILGRDRARVLVSGLVATGLFVVGCNAPTVGAPTVAEYFPLKPGSVFRYRFASHNVAGVPDTAIVEWRILPPRDLNGHTVTPLRHSWEGGRSEFEFYGVDKEGLFLLGVQSTFSSEPKRFSPFVYHIKYPIKPGNAWDVRLPGEDTSYNATIETTDDVVTVPAGTFQRCLRITRRGGSSEKSSWYARHIGLVKLLDKKDARQRSFQLESYTI